MKIQQVFFDEFILQSAYKRYRHICRNLLLGGREYSLNVQPGYDESAFLPENIKTSVQAYTSDKEMAIAVYKDFVKYLNERDYEIEIEFPPVPVNSSFERQMFIAKYLQEEDHSLNDLPEILWVGDRTLREDFRRLSGDDPIQVCGKKFCIPKMERQRGRGNVRFASTMHPIFLSENLTQIIVMLKGLKVMSENPLYANYAIASATEIWNQLSSYAKKRIRVVFQDIMPEELTWFESLEEDRKEIFYTERMCSEMRRNRLRVLLDCMKNGKTFAVEYAEGETVKCYTDCRIIHRGYHRDSIEIECNNKIMTLRMDCIQRSAYTAEELLSD